MFLVMMMLFIIVPNVLGLGEVGELEAQMFSFAQMPNRIPNVQFSTYAPILPNPCYLPFFSSFSSNAFISTGSCFVSMSFLVFITW